MPVSARGRELAAVGALTAAALALFFAAPTYPNYDAYYHLDWGREILHGHAPSFQAYKAPTEHPLYVALCTLLALLGSGADRVLVLVTVLSMVALIWAVYRLGAALFGAWPGLVAAVFAGSSFALLLYAARAYVDVPFLALVFWAGALEAERPRRGVPIMVLLVVAGLLRPEAWVLAGLYWLWCGPRRLDLLVLAAAAPLAWAAVDLAVTGDPLFSLHSTSDLADELHRRKGVAALPGSFVSFLASTVRAPVALGGAIGALLAWRRLPRRTLAVPAALFGAGTVTFVLTGLAGLSVLPRYLTVPAVTLCLFAAYALLGFTSELAGSEARRRWMVVAAAAALVGLGGVAVRAPSPGRLRAELRFVRATHVDLEAVVHDPVVRRGLRCGPLTFPNYRLVPDARWILDAPRGRVGARSAQAHRSGVAVFVVGQKALKRYGFADGASPRTNVPDPGFVPIARHGLFTAYAACPGGVSASRRS